MAALVEIAPDFAPWSDDLTRLDGRIAALEGRQPAPERTAARACDPPCSAGDAPSPAAAAVVLASDARQRIGSLPPAKAKIDN
jgi:hypothetical protein